MSKKLQNNGLWESSRMMLPQHREAIKLQQKEETRIERPRMDEQEAHTMAAALTQSQVYSQLVEVTIYGEYQSRTLTGRVTSHQRDAFRLYIDATVQEHEWVRFKDLIKVELIDVESMFE
ncbi:MULTISPECIES: YolD-like family protein [unclassified Paenibacillus]|uniref:YolD-like family protein n=1 Tax=unclassified Paenibacillus TaxID=185978 RepID=UPI00278A1144|nr:MULTISPECIES: YolD-like family protein [unclassified Paenibacillus]MDQ0896282.1 hypothetical protein [Paenibacillus sp. V4I7]MDQ0913790.1 hypothetical protein [Paenibacillus sp. V4I5]